MVRKTKEEAQETRERLLDAAGDMFSEKGVTKTSLEDIAKAAGVTRGAVYWHFKNKTDLVEALWQRKRMPLDEAWGDCCASLERDPLGRIRANAIEMLRRATNDPNTRQVYDILFHKCERIDDGETIMARCLASRQECVPVIRDYFEAAIEAGQLPEGIEVLTTLAGFFSYLDGLIYNSFLHPEVIRLDQLAEFYVDIYIEGMKHTPARTS